MKPSNIKISNPEGFRYDQANHAYYYKSRRITGINEALESVGLKPSFAAIPKPALEKATYRGNRVHLLTQLLDENDLSEIDIADTGYLDAYESFKRENDFQPEVIEQLLVDPIYFFAGRPDRAGLYRGEPAIVEIKTSKPAPWISYQVSAQDRLLQVVGYRAKMRLSVHLYDNGAFEIVTYRDPRALSIFLAAVAITNVKLNVYGAKQK